MWLWHGCNSFRWLFLRLQLLGPLGTNLGLFMQWVPNMLDRAKVTISSTSEDSLQVTRPQPRSSGFKVRFTSSFTKFLYHPMDATSPISKITQSTPRQHSCISTSSSSRRPAASSVHPVYQLTLRPCPRPMHLNPSVIVLLLPGLKTKEIYPYFVFTMLYHLCLFRYRYFRQL